MKPKGLLFTLFILYWIVVYGVALFSGKFRNDFRQTSVSHFIPYGYSMFTPMTKTKFHVTYDFYKDDNLEKKVSLGEYIESEYDKGLIYNKSTFVKSKIFMDQIYQLDLAFQKFHYQGIFKNKTFEELIGTDSKLKSIVANVQNFSDLYIKENPLQKFDSVLISIKREPMILPFNKNYKGDYTYVIGDTVFYRSNYIFKRSEK